MNFYSQALKLEKNALVAIYEMRYISSVEYHDMEWQFTGIGKIISVDEYGCISLDFWPRKVYLKSESDYVDDLLPKFSQEDIFSLAWTAWNVDRRIYGT